MQAQNAPAGVLQERLRQAARARARTSPRRSSRELAEDPAVRSMDHTKIEPVLQEAVHKHLFIQFIYVTDMTGKKITENITQPEYREQYGDLRPARGLLRQRLVQGRARRRAGCSSPTSTSPASPARCASPSPRRSSDDDGNPMGVIGADLKFEELARMQDALV